MTRARLALRAGLAAVGLVVAVGGVVALLAPGLAPRPTTPGLADAAVAWLLILASASLIAGGTAAWLGRPGAPLAIIAFWAAAAWMAPELAGTGSVPREVRTLGLVLTPLVVPLLVHLPISAARRDSGWSMRTVLVLLYAAAIVVALGHALTWDPFRNPVCEPGCSRGDNVLGWFVDMPLSRTFRSMGWWLAAAAGGVLAAWSLWGLIRRRGDASLAPILVSSTMVGLALAAWGVARMPASRPSPTDAWAMATVVALAAAVIALGVVVTVVQLRASRRAAGVRRVVELLASGAAERPLAESVAWVLDDPSVRIAYARGGGHGFIDDQGGSVPEPTGSQGRSVTPVERAGRVIALVEHAATLDADLLARQIGAAVRLVVDNERLAALLRAQVRELQDSRERLVAAGDAARGQLERDLHDGAQQRLLAVSYELRLAQAAAHGTPGPGHAAVDDAVAEIDRALGELRDLAHGIWPAVLAEAGLEAALGSLADDAPIPVALEGLTEERYPSPVEAAAYLAVLEALGRAGGAHPGGAYPAGAQPAGAQPAGAHPVGPHPARDAASASAAEPSDGARNDPGLVVRLARTADRLMVEARLPGVHAPGPWLRVDDRVGAAGGRSSVTSDPASGTLLVVELPCA